MVLKNNRMISDICIWL